MVVALALSAHLASKASHCGCHWMPAGGWRGLDALTTPGKPALCAPEGMPALRFITLRSWACTNLAIDTPRRVFNNCFNIPI